MRMAMLHLTFFLVLGTSHLAAQKKVYKIKIVTYGGRMIKGILAKATADTVFLYSTHDKVVAYPVRDIARIDLRRKNAVGRGMANGLMIGAVGGALLGAASYQPGGWFDAGRGGQAVGGAILFAPMGGLFGILFSIGRKQFKIADDPRQFDSFVLLINRQ
jgi:hypothetical protein